MLQYEFHWPIGEIVNLPASTFVVLLDELGDLRDRMEKERKKKSKTGKGGGKKSLKNFSL